MRSGNQQLVCGTARSTRLSLRQHSLDSGDKQMLSMLKVWTRAKTTPSVGRRERRCAVFARRRARRRARRARLAPVLSASARGLATPRSTNIQRAPAQSKKQPCSPLTHSAGCALAFFLAWHCDLLDVKGRTAGVRAHDAESPRPLLRVFLRASARVGSLRALASAAAHVRELRRGRWP